MEEFKIRHFIKENPQRQFPVFRSLDNEKASHVLSELSKRVGFTDPLEPRTLTAKLQEGMRPCPTFNAEKKGFNLRELFKFLELTPPTDLLVNWDNYDHIDQFLFDEVSEWFDYIWYPGPDEIELFDLSFSWIIFIDHDGYVSYRRF